MKTTLAFISFFVVSTAAGASRADVITDLPASAPRAITLRTGLDSAVAISAGYAQHLAPAFWRRGVLIFGELTIPAATPDASDSALALGVRTTLASLGRFDLQGALGPVLRNTSNQLFDANAVGVHAALLPGYRNTRFGVMAELGYEKMLATHLRHGALYRELVYPEAMDGWYSSTAGTLRIGLRAGVRVSTWQFALRMGVQSSERGEPHVPPFYATLGGSYAF